MIQRMSHTTIFVTDQDKAKEFYVDKLGFEVRTDATMDNGYRWLTVGPKTQPDLRGCETEVFLGCFDIFSCRAGCVDGLKTIEQQLAS